MKNAGKACNNRLYRHIRTFEKIIKNYFVISLKSENLSRSRYNYVFKKETGLSPKQYLINLRIAKSEWYMKHSNLNISQIAENVGYVDALYFSRVFKKKNGISPKYYINKFRSNGQ